MKLVEYRKKRDPARTNEPFGADVSAAGPTLVGAYVVHLHDATRRHYDVRLEVGGVLTSFAVPRGPSLDPDQKHLAVQTEDHPIEYLEFEAVIPEGQYGAGPMIVWDTGKVRFLDGPAEEGLVKGKLDFELMGVKLRGRFALVRLKPKDRDADGRRASEDGRDWLFFKKADAYANKKRDLVAELPRSVLSGLTVEQLGDAPRIAKDVEARAVALGATETPLARPVRPMLCGSSNAPIQDSDWLYELKLDGVRLVATKRGRDVALHNRKLRDETARYPEILRAVRALAAESVVLDGEVVAFDAQGQPSFQRLGQRMHLSSTSGIRRAALEVPVSYVVFDVLALGAHTLVDLPLVERKKLLGELVPSVGVIRVLEAIEGDGRALLAFCRERQLEGIVAKRARSEYVPGKRSADWAKMKCERDDDFVVVGWTNSERGRRLGAIDVASYSGEQLVVRGKVGSGLDDAMIDVLTTRLAALETDAAPAKGAYSLAPRGRTYARPEIVVRVRHLGWTDDGYLRFPVFLGLRDDVAIRACTAAPPADDDARAEALEAGAPEAGDAAKGRTETKPPAARRVAITNARKVFWPDDHYTKGDLYAYYEAIAEVMLPHLRDRPIMIVRYPDGIAGKHFYQWNVPAGTPSWVQTLRMRSEAGDDDDDDDHEEHEVFVADSVDSLLYLANLGCIPIHVLAARAQHLDQPDFLTIDFDVKNSTLARAIEHAQTLRKLLDEIEMDGFVKTSGQSGLHVFVPLGPGVGYATSKVLCELLGRLIVDRHPDATMERIVSRRGERVYIDTGQTGPSRTIVAPYSVRAHPGATVSTPVRWDEVTLGLDPAEFTIRTVVARAETIGDPMARLFDVRPNIPRSVELIERLVRKSTTLQARR